MEEHIENATDAIKHEAPPPHTSRLITCAMLIAELAIGSYNGKLREKALDVAKAIADFEDELINPT